MGGGSPAERASEQAGALAEKTAKEGYGIGLPALQGQLSQINQGLMAGGEPSYVSEAFGSQRTGIFEGASESEAGSMKAQAAATKGAQAGGNAGAGLIPPGYGAELARAMMGSRVTEKMGGLEESMNLMTMGVGGGTEAGSAAMGAGRSSLQAIGMMPQYNTDLANVLMAANTAGSVYGAGSQAGWWGGNPAVSGGVAAGMAGGDAGLRGWGGG
jgi:hypothetical protein